MKLADVATAAAVRAAYEKLLAAVPALKASTDDLGELLALADVQDDLERRYERAARAEKRLAGGGA